MSPDDKEKKAFAEKILAKLKEERKVKKNSVGQDELKIIEDYIKLYENYLDSEYQGN